MIRDRKNFISVLKYYSISLILRLGFVILSIIGSRENKMIGVNLISSLYRVFISYAKLSKKKIVTHHGTAVY